MKATVRSESPSCGRCRPWVSRSGSSSSPVAIWARANECEPNCVQKKPIGWGSMSARKAEPVTPRRMPTLRRCSSDQTPGGAVPRLAGGLPGRLGRC